MAIILGTAIKTLMLDDAESPAVAQDIKGLVKQVEITSAWPEYNKTALGDTIMTYAALKKDATIVMTCNLDHTLVGMFDGDTQAARTLQLGYVAQGETAMGIEVNGEVVLTNLSMPINSSGETELVATFRPASSFTITEAVT